MKREILKKQERLCFKFMIGYQSHKYAEAPITDFHAEDIVVLLGHLYRIHNIAPPRAINIDKNNFKRLISDDDKLYAFSIVNNGILLIELDGPEEGEELFIERPDTDLASLKLIFQSRTPHSKAMTGFLEALSARAL